MLSIHSISFHSFHFFPFIPFLSILFIPMGVRGVEWKEFLRRSGLWSLAFEPVKKVVRATLFPLFWGDVLRGKGVGG
jgi:hypothetical protein